MRWIICLAFLVVGNACAAQTTTNAWFSTINTFRIDSNFSLNLDIQVRSTDKAEHLSTFIFRPAINWHFRKNMFFTIGYAAIQNRRSIQGQSGYVPEQRIWQQLTVNHSLGVIPIQHRLRLEQRFIGRYTVTNGDFTTGGNAFANRLRYFTRAIIPFNASKPFTKGMFAAAQNEVFVNLGNKSAVNGRFFDQNRLYLAVGYRLSKKFDIDAGYLNQYIVGANKAISRAHIIQLGTYLRL